VSEAVLCAGDKAPEVIAWAFEVQDQIREQAKTDPAAATRIVTKRFPQLATCIGTPDARSRLNKSLRWAVANNLRVLTPQLFVDNVKLCDEDVDLGLEYALTAMLERHAHGTLAQLAPAAAPAAAKPAERLADRPAPTDKPAKPENARPSADEPVARPSDQNDKAPPAERHPEPDKPVTSPDKPVTAPDQVNTPPPPPTADPGAGSQGGAP
jgi:hypothetical protein